MASGILMIGVWVSLFAFPATTDWWTRQDNAVLRWFVELRTDTLTSLAKVVAMLGSSWFVRFLRIGTLIGLMQAPAAKLARWMNAPGGQLARVVDARRKSLEEAGYLGTDDFGNYGG